MSSRIQLIALMNSKVISGNRETTAQKLRDFETDMIASAVNATDDADVNGGYMKISLAGIANIAFLKKATPTYSEFLRDDGTWASALTSAPNLNAVLTTGNTTAGKNILVSDDDYVLIGSDSARIITCSTLTVNKGMVFVNSNAGETMNFRDIGGMEFNTDLVVSNGYKIKSASGNSIIQLYGGGGEQFVSQLSTGETISSLAGVVKMDMDGTSVRYISTAAGVNTFKHNIQNTFDSPINRFTGDAFFVTGTGIDSVLTLGTDTLNIGATNANVINYGNASTIHNFLGTAIYELQVNSYVTDKLITLNYGGAVSSGIGVGFEIEENSVITGYFKTNAARNAFSILTPAIAYRADLSLASLTADHVYTLPDATGTLALSSTFAGYVPYSGATGSVTLGVYTLTTPKVIGGTAVGDTVSIQGTSGNGTSSVAAINFLVGNNGATVAASYYNDGMLNIGNAAKNATAFGIVRIGQGTGWVDIGERSSGSGAIWLSSTPSATNYALASNSTNTVLNAASSIQIATIGSIRATFASSTVVFAPSATSSAATTFTFTSPNHTTQTAGTNIPEVLFTLPTKQFAAGALPTLYFIHGTNPTISFVSSSTASDAYTAFFAKPLAGTNATITNAYALGTSGDVYFQVGSVTNGIKFTGLVGTLTEPAIYLNQATPSASNYTFWQSGGSFQINSASGILTRIANATQQSVTASAQSFTPGSANSGAVTSFTFQPAGNSSQTASTQIQGINFALGTRNWLAGGISVQREILVSSITYSFATSSTIGEATTLYLNAVTAGTNATITNSFPLQLTNSTYTIKFGQLTGDATSSAIYMNQSTPSATNYTFNSDGSVLSVNGATVRLKINNLVAQNITSTALSFTPGAASSGSTQPFLFTLPNSTNQTASTEVQGFATVGGTIQHAAGTLATQRDHFFAGRIHAFTSSSTLSNLYTVYIEGGAAGTNATVSNLWSLGTGGDVYFGVGSVANGIKFMGMVGTTTNWAIYTDVSSPSATNYSFGGTSTQTRINAASDVVVRIANSTIVNLDANTQQFQGIPKNSLATSYTFSVSAHTGQTASTESPQFKVNGATITWSAGTLATQRFNYWTANTIAFASSSTASVVYGNYFAVPVAGTNATITALFAAGFGGSIEVTGNVDATAYKLSSGTIISASGAAVTMFAASGYTSVIYKAAGTTVFTTTATSATFAGNIINSLPIRLKGYTVGTLPVGVQGDVAFVTDATAPTYLATVVGGGAVVTEVFYDGTNWVAS